MVKACMFSVFLEVVMRVVGHDLAAPRMQNL